MSDPEVWFSVCARMDGLDPGSTAPAERLKFVVYQRRLLADALKTKAMLYALLGDGDRASSVAREYFSVAFPVPKDVELRDELRREEMLAELEALGPLKVMRRPS